jgi:DHA3 family macrolide efflux protein-like MFS transporter
METHKPNTTHWKKTFYILWTGQFVSLISSSAINFALIIWLSLETGSAEVLAMAAIAGLLPQTLIGPIAGVYVDRWPRKTTMILADAFIALCTLAMAVLLYKGSYDFNIIYGLLALRSIGSAFHMPALQASIPLLAPEDQLLRIAGVNQIIQSSSSIAGPALGAIAIGLMDISMVLLLDVAGACIAILTLLYIHIPRPTLAQQNTHLSPFKKVKDELSIGAKTIYQHPGIRLLFLFSILVTFFLMPLAVLFPLLTLQHFGGGKFEMSLIEVVWGVGMLVGGSFLSIFKPNTNKIILINAMHILLGISLSLSGVLSASGFYLFVALTILGGLSASIFSACFTTVLQEKIDASLLGRVFSIYYSIALLPSLLGLVGTGFLADQIGVRLTFVILGAVIILIGICSFFFPQLLALGLERNSVKKANPSSLEKQKETETS